MIATTILSLMLVSFPGSDPQWKLDPESIHLVQEREARDRAIAERETAAAAATAPDHPQVYGSAERERPEPRLTAKERRELRKAVKRFVRSGAPLVILSPDPRETAAKGGTRP
jgi:hypothetical protein